MQTQQQPISIEATLPSEIYESIASYLDDHPDWDVDRLMTAGTALFLLQNGCVTTCGSSRDYRRTARVYLDALFKTRSN